MEGEIDLHKVPLSSLTSEARTQLFCLLDASKILFSEGPDKLPRDWRGLATLVNISSEIAGSFHKDRTAKVIEHWMQKRDGTATIGRLLEFVQRIDRYDIFDDFVNLQANGALILNQPVRSNALALRGCQALTVPDDEIQEDLLTFDDKIHGGPQFYHAYILYAQEDRDFVDEMLVRMREKGYKMCTEEDLLPDHQTTYTPVARLISSERCRRIILIYSPDFLHSPANNFYMDYAQAVGIEMKKPKIVPVMYRYCLLPPQVSFYHKLYFHALGGKSSFDFWVRLGLSLDVQSHTPRLNGTSSTSSFSTLNITELSMNSASNSGYTNGTSGQYPATMLALPGPSRSVSMNGIDGLSNGSPESNSSTTSGSSGRTSNRLRSFMNTLRFKKKKNKNPKN